MSTAVYAVRAETMPGRSRFACGGSDTPLTKGLATGVVTEEPPHVLDLQIPAAAESLSSMRRAVRAWLRQLGIGQPDADEILIVCNEICANAIEHGGADGGEGVHVTGTVRDGLLRVEVGDRGRWRYGRPSRERGQGLRIVRKLMDEVAIRRSAHGTDVVMYRRLRAPGSSSRRIGGASPAL
jgi:anti-sigma regulatory factor (Ser/Thr protein kinase)